MYQVSHWLVAPLGGSGFKMKLLLPLITAMTLNAQECTCPHAIDLMNNELSELTGTCTGINCQDAGYSSILASGSPPTSPRQRIFNPTEKAELDQHISRQTGNHFTQTGENEFQGLGPHDTAYIGFYHLDIAPRFPFNSRCTAVPFGDFTTRGSTGIGSCDHTDTMIRFITPDNKFIYFKSGETQITGVELFYFCQNYQIDICQITIPHILINAERNFTPPQSRCIFTNTPFGIVRQKYTIEFDPCLRDATATFPTFEITHTFEFNSPFSFCLTDIMHNKIFASGIITGPDQLIEFTQSRFNYGCNPSHPGDSYE